MKLPKADIILHLLLTILSLPFFPIHLVKLFKTKTGIMTLQDFIALGGMEQLEVFWSGVFVGELNNGEFRMVCHQVNDFYIQAKILGGHYLELKTFRNPSLLEPYLEQIDIPNFFC